MRSITFSALLLSGSMMSMVAAHSANETAHIGHEVGHTGHGAPQMSVAPPLQATDGEGAVRIIPSGKRTGALTMTVTLRAETVGLAPPMKFHWSLGNGQEWNGLEPPPQVYIVGRYDVILTVTDSNGKVRKASTKIDAESHGCGV